MVDFNRDYHSEEKDRRGGYGFAEFESDSYDNGSEAPPLCPSSEPTFPRRYTAHGRILFYGCDDIKYSVLGITLSCMVNSTAIALEAQHDKSTSESNGIGMLLNSTGTDSCNGELATHVIDYGGSYEWSVETQGHIVGAAFIGGMISVFPSGIAIDYFSIRHLLLFSGLILSVVSVLVPISAEKIGAVAVMVLRFFMGIGEGIMLPGINGMLVGWFPLHEKSTAAALYTSGNQLAGIVGNPVAAGFCASSLRWPAVFYASGLLGFLWCAVWHFTVNNSPANTKWISDHEVAYLQHHLPKKQHKSEKKIIPWGAMIRSPPVLVLFYSSIVTNMMIAMILVYIPVFFKDVLLVEVRQNGFYTAIPHICNLLSKLLWGFLMDHLKKNKILTATQSVKLSQVISMLLLSTSFLALAYGVDCTSHKLALFLLCTIGAAFGLSISGFLTSLLSITPNFIGVLTSVCQVIGFGGRAATPQIVTYFKTIGTIEEWRGVLLVYSALTVLSAIVFSIWGSGDVQPWDLHREESTRNKDSQRDSQPLVDPDTHRDLNDA